MVIGARRQRGGGARGVLVADIVINLAMLAFFKYYDLFAETLSLIPGLDIPPLGLGLPIGISFYTFQTMSYPIDVYRGDTEVQRSFIRFGTFVALFPQLIAGPIVRYKDIASQLGARDCTPDRFASGVRRFCVGLGKKVLLANNLRPLPRRADGAGRMDGHLRLYPADLFRLLRLFRHGHRPGTDAGL